MLGALIAVTFLLKFAVPIGGGQQLFLCFFVIYGLTGYGVLSGKLQVHHKRFALYMLMLSGLYATQLLGGYEFSFLSILMLTLIHLPYIFELTPAAGEEKNPNLLFVKILSIIAILGIVQFFGQYIIGSTYAFFLDTMAPQSLIMQGFHGYNPLHDKGAIYKSNGFFIQEPSNFSQLLALALVIEMVFFRNMKRIALFLVALALTFSGTGLLMLMAVVPFYLLFNKKFIIMLVLAAGLLTAPVWAPAVGLEKTVKRSESIVGSNKTSSYGRFFSSFDLVQDFVLPEGPRTVLFGLGAGAMPRTITQEPLDYYAASSTWGKIFFEYGVVGMIFYFGFMGYIFFSSRGNPYVVAALVLQFLIMGEHVFPPTVHGLILALLVWPSVKRGKEGLYPKEIPAPIPAQEVKI